MKSGFSKVVVANIPIPKNQFKSSKNCIICPKTKNYSLIGIAFDYLLRSELKRLHPTSIENELIAETSISLVSQYVELNGYYPAKNKQIGQKELLLMKNVAESYKQMRAVFIEDGVLTDDFIEATIKFARMDAIYNLISEEFKKSSDPILLDPTFGEASRKVGGADVDLIRGDTMIDIKTTKEMKLDGYLWSQMVGYLILADEAHSNERILPKIQNFGLYFSRYGCFWKINASYVRENRNYEEVKRKLLKTNMQFKL
jgi:hypothetical protein